MDSNQRRLLIAVDGGAYGLKRRDITDKAVPASLSTERVIVGLPCSLARQASSSPQQSAGGQLRTHMVQQGGRCMHVG